MGPCTIAEPTGASRTIEQGLRAWRSLGKIDSQQVGARLLVGMVAPLCASLRLPAPPSATSHPMRTTRVHSGVRYPGEVRVC